MKTIKLSLVACSLLMIGFTSCKKDDPITKTTPSITKVDSIQAAFSATGPFTFFSFKDDKVIAASDSNSTKWDFAFRFVEIRVNSYSSGPGSVGVITQKGIFDDLKMAPETGYGYDTSRNQLAINGKDRDPNAWYLYDPTVHALTPKAGQFFIFRTSENKYVKMEILSVTTDVPFTNPVPPTKIWYKFRYTYQPDGSRNF